MFLLAATGDLIEGAGVVVGEVNIAGTLLDGCTGVAVGGISYF